MTDNSLRIITKFYRIWRYPSVSIPPPGQTHSSYNYSPFHAPLLEKNVYAVPHYRFWSLTVRTVGGQKPDDVESLEMMCHSITWLYFGILLYVLFSQSHASGTKMNIYKSKLLTVQGICWANCSVSWRNNWRPLSNSCVRPLLMSWKMVAKSG